MTKWNSRDVSYPDWPAYTTYEVFSWTHFKMHRCLGLLSQNDSKQSSTIKCFEIIRHEIRHQNWENKPIKYYNNILITISIWKSDMECFTKHLGLPPYLYRGLRHQGASLSGPLGHGVRMVHQWGQGGWSRWWMQRFLEWHRVRFSATLMHNTFSGKYRLTPSSWQGHVDAFSTLYLHQYFEFLPGKLAPEHVYQWITSAAHHGQQNGHCFQHRWNVLRIF